MESLTDKMNFGKYRNRTIQEVIEDDPTYIEWALDNVDWFELDDEAMDVYEKAIKEHYRDDDLSVWWDEDKLDYGDR